MLDSTDQCGIGLSVAFIVREWLLDRGFEAIMSLIDFPPMDGPGAVTIQELGGRLVNGNYRDVLRLHQSQLLAGYPVIEKTQLMGLQHSLSREDIRSVFIHGRTGAVRVWDVWKNEGFSGVLRYAATMTDGLPLQPSDDDDVRLR
uniref:Uncharacterized protein n=1 Tax=Plectus sambesii TaxID=2011161 RepID=A0A914VZI5_9BILA